MEKRFTAEDRRIRKLVIQTLGTAGISLALIPKLPPFSTSDLDVKDKSQLNGESIPTQTSIINGRFQRWFRGGILPEENLQQNGMTLLEFLKMMKKMADNNELPHKDPSAGVGLFTDRKLNAYIGVQPEDQPTYVIPLINVATPFNLANRYGIRWLLAHNDTGIGEKFGSIIKGDSINIVTKDMKLETYETKDVARYQALDPNSPYSNFLDINNNAPLLSSSQLFYKVVEEVQAPNTKPPTGLILQTCIYANGDYSWGRLFVLAKKSAEPVSVDEKIRELESFKRQFQIPQ